MREVIRCTMTLLLTSIFPRLYPPFENGRVARIYSFVSIGEPASPQHIDKALRTRVLAFPLSSCFRVLLMLAIDVSGN